MIADNNTNMPTNKLDKNKNKLFLVNGNCRLSAIVSSFITVM
jgi:hypothetical protein